jgi:hypothetical protein
MGMTIVSFGDKRATIEPNDANRIGSGYRETRENGSSVLFNTFEEAIADAVGMMFTA